MKIEEQVCSVELAKKLKEIGVGQESYWYWAQGTHYTDPFTNLVDHYDAEKMKENVAGQWEKYSAFTVAELGEMLQKWIWICKDSTYFCTGYALNPDPSKSMCEKMPVEMCGAIDGATTEADARAKMLVYLMAGCKS